MQEPTEQDHRNATVRAEVAERFRTAYAQVLAWSMGAFGPGWEPSHRHELVEKAAEEQGRRTGERARASATVYTVKNAEGARRHFMVEHGKVREVAGYEEGFGAMMLEPDLTRTIEVFGKQVHPHRYSLIWADYPLYEPKTAEQLSTLRESREKRKAEREERKWAEKEPLWKPLAERDGLGQGDRKI